MVLNIQPVLVTTTVDKEEVAQAIAKLVLEKRLAACVQILPPITSLYWWQGEIASDTEYLISMKSDRKLFNLLNDTIGAVHSYEVPEIIATEIVEIDNDYAAWMKKELSYEQ